MTGISPQVAIYVRKLLGRPHMPRGQQLILVLSYSIYILLVDGCARIRFFQSGKGPLLLLLGLSVDIDDRAASGGDPFHI